MSKRELIGIGAVMAEVAYLSTTDKPEVLMEEVAKNLTKRFNFLSIQKAEETIDFAKSCGVIESDGNFIKLKNRTPIGELVEEEKENE